MKYNLLILLAIIPIACSTPKEKTVEIEFAPPVVVQDTLSVVEYAPGDSDWNLPTKEEQTSWPEPELVAEIEEVVVAKKPETKPVPTPPKAKPKQKPKTKSNGFTSRAARWRQGRR